VDQREPGEERHGRVRVVLQRVSRAAVRVDGKTVGEIGLGFLVLAGFALPIPMPRSTGWRTRSSVCAPLRG